MASILVECLLVENQACEAHVRMSLTFGWSMWRATYHAGDCMAGQMEMSPGFRAYSLTEKTPNETDLTGLLWSRSLGPLRLESSL